MSEQEKNEAFRDAARVEHFVAQYLKRDGIISRIAIDTHDALIQVWEDEGVAEAGVAAMVGKCILQTPELFQYLEAGKSGDEELFVAFRPDDAVANETMHQLEQRIRDIATYLATHPEKRYRDIPEHAYNIAEPFPFN